MKGNKMKIIGLALLVLACGTNKTGNLVPRYETFKYSGETFDHYVEAEELFMGNRCVERRIVLRIMPGLHNNKVSYVRATDRDCNDSVDDWQFRDTRDRMTSTLEQDIIQAFYQVKYK